MTVTDPAQTNTPADRSDGKSVRLYYLDWLRVILIFGVFLYHALHPFVPNLPWHIKNAEESEAIMAMSLLVYPWGIPLFFLVAGAGSKFSLRRRGNRQYISERVTRLLIPFIVGSILLTPLQEYLDALHKGTFQGSFLSFIPEMLAESTSGNLLTPLVFSRWGSHLWFLAFLFAFSLLALPVFRWFQRDAGQSSIAWLGRLVEKRGGLLLFVLPLALSRVLIQPYFPEDHGWLDFVYYFLFFISGYIIYSDDRFLSAVRRDRWLLFAGGVLGLVAFGGVFAAFGDQFLEWWTQTFVVPWSIILVFSFVLMSWGWALDALYLAKARLNYSNKWLVYGSDTIMPFYLLHQPVIVVIAFFVVQWDAGITLKLLVVVLGSLLVTLGLVEVIKRISVLRGLFGIKTRRRETPSTQADLSR
jgi:peptidoglycan/LPS O-acetylase OafA/YrhL